MTSAYKYSEKYPFLWQVVSLRMSKKNHQDRVIKRKRMRNDGVHFIKKVWDKLQESSRFTVVGYPHYNYIVFDASTRYEQRHLDRLLKKAYSNYASYKKNNVYAAEHKSNYDREYVDASIHRIQKPDCWFAVYETSRYFVVEYYSHDPYDWQHETENDEGENLTPWGQDLTPKEDPYKRLRKRRK